MPGKMPGKMPDFGLLPTETGVKYSELAVDINYNL
jgi:hypothetical protein